MSNGPLTHSVDPVDNTEIGLGGRERHVVVHRRLAEVSGSERADLFSWDAPVECGVDIAVAAAKPDQAIAGGCAKVAQASCRQHETR